MPFCTIYASLLLVLAYPVFLSYKHPYQVKAQTGASDNRYNVFSLIPDNFPTRGDYTVRCVSQDGMDDGTCLDSQPNPSEFSNSWSDNFCCLTLRYALFGSHSYNNTESVSNLIVLLQPGNYTYGDVSIVLVNFTNLVISKMPGTSGEVVLFCNETLEKNYNNLYITASTYVAINDIVFERCGPLSPGMGIMAVNWLTVSNCIARNNYHSGIITFQSENITFSNCIFENNNSTAPYNIPIYLDPGEIRFSGGLSISWQNLATNSFAKIIDCTFRNNMASISLFNLNDTRPNLYIRQGHGGAITTHFDNTSNHELLVHNTTVFNNQARLNGGGAYFTFYKNANNNNIKITNSIFEENESRFGTGGGISMSTFFKANNNIAVISNTQFISNIAKVGGGAFSLNIQDQLIKRSESQITNVASFMDCEFEYNLSPEGGSAVSLVSNARVDQALNTTDFINCSFINNTANEEGAVMSLRFPFKFDGTTVIKNNMGGGVAVLQSRMDVGGSIRFEGNTANLGGALMLRDQSVIHLLRNVRLTFLSNHAKIRGGAISVISPTVGLDTDVIRLFNTRCFIQYDVLETADATMPSEWNATFQFINNTAVGNGAAIHATDIRQCTYAPSLTARNVDSATIIEKSIFSLSQLFQFSGNKVMDNTTVKANPTIATAPSQLLVQPDVVTGAPGEVIEFRINAVDQSKNPRRAVWSPLDNSVTMDPTEAQVYFVLTDQGSTYRYIVHSEDGFDYENCSGDLNQTLHSTKIDFNLVQIIAGDIASSSTSTIKVACCHPGYVFNKDRSVCEHNRNNRVILRGDANRRYLYIEPEHYAMAGQDGRIISAVISPTFQKCTTQGTLRGCLFKFDDMNDQCSNNRTDFLCGKCPSGTGLDLTLRNCTECTPGATVIVALIVIAFVIATGLVLAFNIGVPNELKGCFFFVQVVGFVYQGGTDWDFHLSRFLASFYIPLCPLPFMNAYVSASYGWVLSFFCVVTIIVYVISARFIRRLGNHSSLEGIWLLCIITIKYTADTAYLILRCQKVTGEGIQGHFVYFYDGTKQCFAYNENSTHLGFAIFAIFFLVVVISSIIAILVISYKRFKHTQAFTDILTNGIKVSCRWWSAFDLFRRLLIVLVALSLNYIQPDLSQLAQFAVVMVIFFIFACAQPYNDKRSNIIEAFILLDLLILTAFFLNTDDPSQSADNGLAAVLLLLPFIYGFLYIVFKIVSILWKKRSPMSFMRFCKQVHDLMITGHWIRRTKGSISHDLDTFVSVNKNSAGSVTQTDLVDSSEFCADYNELREELLDEQSH